jgi:hypothetical protein
MNRHKKIAMKKLVIVAAIAGFISLGFTVVNNTPEKIPVVKSQKSEKMDFSSKLDEKRLASWD